ncbi:MAG: hypothetical protein QNJ91_03710 [Gammaproteobacteria bacterium]|nr:hypothetical protein [Gammaproteobacteria bacterium]
MPVHDAQKQLSILILCEDRPFGHYVKNALESVGYPPAAVSNSPRDALARFVHDRFDLAVISSALQDPDALEVVRDIRAGATYAPRDLVILMLQSGESADTAERIHAGMLGINAFLPWPASIDALQHAVAEAISHHHLALEVIDTIAEADQPPRGDDVDRGQFSAETFGLPAAALVEGMYLEDSVTIHGRVLIPAGTVLNEAHLHALESLELVLESSEIRVRFARRG